MKSKYRTLLADESEILARWKEYFKQFLHQVQGGRASVPLGAENISINAEVADDILLLESEKPRLRKYNSS